MKEGKYYVIQMIVNYCISVTDNAELLEKCNWNKNVEDNLKMIIGSSSPEKKRYLLLDAGILSDREKMESLYSLAKWGVMKGWIVVLATSSGQGWTASIKNQNTMAELMCIVHTQLSKVEINPFMKSEAIQFLEINKVDKLWHECILNVAGRIPLLLSLFRKVQSSESLGESQSSMLRLVDSIVDDLACAQKALMNSIAVPYPRPLLGWLEQQEGI